MKPSTKRHATAVALLALLCLLGFIAVAAPFWAYAAIAALFGYPTAFGFGVGAGALSALCAALGALGSCAIVGVLYRQALVVIDEDAVKTSPPLALPAALGMVAVYKDGVLTYAHAPGFDLRDEVIAEASREIATLRAQLEGSMAETRAVCVREVELAQALARLQPTS